MVKELTITFLSLLMFFSLVFATELKGIFVGTRDVPQKRQAIAGSCAPLKGAAEKSRHGWGREADR